MLLDEQIQKLQNLTKSKITRKQIGDVLGMTQQAVKNRIDRQMPLAEFEILKLEEAFLKDVPPEVVANQVKNKLTEIHNTLKEQNGIYTITYRPDVYLSAGYGVEVFNEAAEKITIDARLLETEKGTKINPKNCELVRVSGNSMAPEYRHGDRVIIDKSDTELIDGHIFAFKYNGQCFVKEINILSDKIKCISLNKEYDPFYIKKGEQFTVFGRILPRIRL